MKRLQLCADDFALNPCVDAGIEALAAQGRLTHVSAMSSQPRWPEVARRLAHLPVPMGLHFNLTEGTPLSPALRAVWPRFPGLGKLLLLSGLRALPVQALSDEWRAQLDHYTEARGAPPQFLDGHQHVHALPGVRESVLETARRLNLPVRNTGRLLGPGFAFKRRVIERCGGRALLQQLREQGLPHAEALVGAYDFAPRANYRTLMRAWLAALPENGTTLLFCHPARGCHPGDAIAAAREREAAYLASSAFSEDLAEFGVTWG